MTVWQQGKWQRPFFTIWIGQAFSLIGSSLVQFALVWWLTAKTGSATVLAVATLIALLPDILLAPVAGALVDRWNRRIVILVADSAIGLVSLLLAFLFITDSAQVWHICVVMLARAAAGAFHWPAMEASTSLMVPERHLSRVAGLNQAMNGVVTVVSPPLGALLYAALPIHQILFVDVGTALLAVIPLLFIPLPQPPRAAAPTEAGAAPAASVWRDVRDGFRYIAAWRGLMILMGIGMAVNFLMEPAFALAPILVTNHFGGEALELAWLESAWGVGMAVGGLLLGVWGGFKRRIVTTLVGMVGLGVGVLVLGLAPASAFWMGLVGLFITGCMMPVASGPLHAIMQATVEPGMQGRVLSTFSAVVWAVSPAGLLIVGPVADAVDVRVPYIAGGLALVLLGIAGFFIPALMRIEQDRREATSEAAASTQPAAG
ncbi:MAG: MFS transporter [Anaerolineae bacterium]